MTARGVAILFLLAGCDAVPGSNGPEAEGWFEVRGERHQGEASIQIFDDIPPYDMPVRTELNVTTRQGFSSDDQILTFRIHGLSDFREELREGSVLAGVVEDVYQPTGQKERAYVAANIPERATYFGTGSYQVRFGEGRIVGSFDVDWTSLVDENGDQLEFEPASLNGRFNLPYSLTCWVKQAGDPTTHIQDEDFATDLCTDFKSQD